MLQAGHWLLLATQEAEIRKITIGNQSWANSSKDPILKIPNTKKGAGGVAQVVEHLPSKHEALNSSPNTVKKKKKQ
jgi:hypothetical protein